MPLFRGFNATLDPVLRDGQTVQTVASTDPVTGEVVKIVVVKRAAGLTADELIEFSRSRLAAYKVPKYVEFSKEELPKTNVGKILRRALR